MTKYIIHPSTVLHQWSLYIANIKLVIFFNKFGQAPYILFAKWSVYFIHSEIYYS